MSDLAFRRAGRRAEQPLRSANARPAGGDRRARCRLAARAVARLALLLGFVVSRMTMLRVVMALPEPVWAVPRVPGVDPAGTIRGPTAAA